MTHLVGSHATQTGSMRSKAKYPEDHIDSDRLLLLGLTLIRIWNQLFEPLRRLRSGKTARPQILDSCSDQIVALRIVSPVSIPLTAVSRDASALPYIVREEGDSFLAFGEIESEGFLRRFAKENRPR